MYVFTRNKCLLEVLDVSAGEAFNLVNIFFPSGPVFFLDLSVFFAVLDVQLSELVPFTRRMVLNFEGDFSTSPDPAASDFEVGFITVDTDNTESVLSERFESLEETVHQVAGQETNFTFTFGLFVFHSPDGVTLVIELFPEGLEGFLLVGMVDEEGLVVEEVERRGGEGVEGVQSLFCLGFFFFFFLLFLLGLRSSLFLLGLRSSSLLGFGLLFFRKGASVGGDGGLADDNSTEDFGELRFASNSLDVLDDGGELSSESFISSVSEDEEEVRDDLDISDGDLATDEGLSFLNETFQDSEDRVKLFSGLSERLFSGSSPSDDLSLESEKSRFQESGGPVEVLVNLSFFPLVGTVDLSTLAQSSDVSEDSVGFVDGTFGGFKDGDLSIGVLLLEFLKSFFRGSSGVEVFLLEVNLSVSGSNEDLADSSTEITNNLHEMDV